MRRKRNIRKKIIIAAIFLVILFAFFGLYNSGVRIETIEKKIEIESNDFTD